jgi:hypothetical protein
MISSPPQLNASRLVPPPLLLTLTCHLSFYTSCHPGFKNPFELTEIRQEISKIWPQNSDLAIKFFNSAVTARF